MCRGAGLHCAALALGRLTACVTYLKFASTFLKNLCQRILVVILAGMVRSNAQEVINLILWAIQMSTHFLMPLLGCHVATRDAEQLRTGWQEATTMQLQQRRQRLLLSQVARRAKHNNGQSIMLKFSEFW